MKDISKVVKNKCHVFVQSTRYIQYIFESKFDLNNFSVFNDSIIEQFHEINNTCKDFHVRGKYIASHKRLSNKDIFNTSQDIQYELALYDSDGLSKKNTLLFIIMFIFNI